MVNVLATAYRDGDMLGLSIPAAKESVRIDDQQIAARLILCSDYYLSNSHEHAGRIAREIMAMAPEFCLSDYAPTQPYKDEGVLSGVISTLHDAGLPA